MIQTDKKLSKPVGFGLNVSTAETLYLDIPIY